MAMFRSILLALGSTLLSGAPLAHQPVDLGPKAFPESLDVGKDGTLYIGSIANGTVLRAAPGAARADVWIAKDKGKLSGVLGVVVDETRDNLWVCSSDVSRAGEPVSLKNFDLKAGVLKADYPFPDGKGFCNDIAIAKDGTLYATDTPGALIYRLPVGGTKLEPWLKDQRLEGIDGIAFGSDDRMYVNNIRTNEHYRIEVKRDGGSGEISPIATSRPVEGPDGMRPTGDGRFVIAENRGGRVSVATVEGDTLKIETIKEGFDNPPAVAVHGNTVWVIEAKSKYRNNPEFNDKDPGPFMATPVPLPAKK